MSSRAWVFVCLMVGISLTLLGCGGGSTPTATPAALPVIMTHPANQTVAAGQSATFSAAATGNGPITYQWQKNDASIMGATASTYKTPPVTVADSGSKFRVLVSNAAGSTTSNQAMLTVDTIPAALSITQQPANQTVTVGSPATLTVVAAGTAPLTYQWQKNGVAVAGATAATYTTPATVLADNGAKFLVVVSNASGNVTSSEAMLTVTAASAAMDVVTYHNDLARTGQNLSESILTTANVNSGTFGKLRSLPVDGKVDAQPLYLDACSNIAGATHNVLYVATEHDTVYAFDADSGTQLWQVSLLGAGETTERSRGMRSDQSRDRGYGNSGDRSSRGSYLCGGDVESWVHLFSTAACS